MKHIKSYKLFESIYDNVDIDKIEKYISIKLDFLTGKSKQDTDLDSLIYNGILRGGEVWNKKNTTPEIEKFLNNSKSSYEKLTDGLLKYTKNDLLKITQNPAIGEPIWVECQFNRFNKKKDDSKTYNYYITFKKTPDNIKKAVNSFQKLINKSYNYCMKMKVKMGFKFGATLDYFIDDKDHIKFYYYDLNDKNNIVDLVNEWLKENNIETEKRNYEHGIDTKNSSGEKKSTGELVSKEVGKKLLELMVQNKDKFTPKQYTDWLMKLMNDTKISIN